MRRDGARRVWFALLTLPVAVLLFANTFVFSSREFWIAMASGTLVLAALAALVRGVGLYQERDDLLDLALGVGSFALLYAVFWLGDKVVRALVPFAAGQIGAVYGLGEQLPLALIATLLVFVIAPGEELYWRGLLQWSVAARWGPGPGFFAGWLLYTGAHLVSGSLVVVLAALVAGFVWSALYAVRERLFPVIVSHALFDLFVFVIAPVAPR